MQIVHIITRLIVGGAQENTILSCEGQHARGHDVTLISGPPVGPEGSLLERAQSAGYRVEIVDEMRRAISPIRDWKAYRALLRRLREIRPDVVHTHSSKAGILGRRAAYRAKVPAVIHTLHGLAFTASKSPGINEIYKKLERMVTPISDRIVCVADAMREQSLAAKIGRPEQYVTVYSGMETEPFLNPPVPREEVRRQLGLAQGDVAVGTIARLFHQKGHDDLLDMAPKLCKRIPQLRFLWIGDGILREKFEWFITQMGLRDRFILTGLVSPSRIPELVNAMDIVAHPSRREGLARALPQGALAGCADVTYDIDGNREAVIEGKTGFVIPPFDKRKFAEAITTLAEDEPLRRGMGLSGREFALSRFDTRVMVDALDKVYEDVLRTKRNS